MHKKMLFSVLLFALAYPIKAQVVIIPFGLINEVIIPEHGFLPGKKFQFYPLISKYDFSKLKLRVEVFDDRNLMKLTKVQRDEIPLYLLDFHSLDITKAEVHDINFLKNIKQQMTDCVLLGYRGYLSESIQLDLFQTVNIKLETPKRANQKDYKPQPYILRKSRKRIETLFSQLCDQFRIRNNYAKTFEGFKTRILAKITALTLVQFINKFIFDRPISNIKNQII